MTARDPDAASLARCGYTDAWFESASPELALTIRVCARELVTHDLWRFVSSEVDSDIGTMQVTVTDVDALRDAVRDRGFAHREQPIEAWDASERTFGPSLHVKHFAGWPENKVQFHVDRAGLWLPRVWWWLPPVPLVQFVLHAVHYNSYRDVRTLARLLDVT